MDKIIKYPRTPHIKGSKLQPGDEDLNQIPLSFIMDKYLVIEEKIDGANVAISFIDGSLMLQSRGHYLTGGYRERHYNLFKEWAYAHNDDLFKILGNRYIMYGEWMYAKHKVYYDNLPHYFLEFDIFDKENNVFLSTKKRMEMLKDTIIYSVPILECGKYQKIEDILKLITKSNYISSNYLFNLKEECDKLNLDYEEIVKESDLSGLMEGLYIKIEDDGVVLDRMKYVRYDYTQNIEPLTNWLDRTIIPNKLDKDFYDLF